MSTWKELRDNPRLYTIFATRSAIIQLIRQFFWSNDFLETDTPVAVRLPGQEPYLNPIPLVFHEPNGAAHSFFLHTSPEFGLKKLLGAGFPKIFSITKCFRDFEDVGETHSTHNTEFTMMEWYRAPGTLEEIMDDTEKLFKYVGRHLKKDALAYQGKKFNLHETWDRVTMRELWHNYLGVELNDHLTLESLQKLAKKRHHPFALTDEYEDLFFKIFLNEIEPHLGKEKPLFVYDYPKRMCSLSRTSAQDERYAERFELYVGGLELANAFGELTDAAEQAKRLQEDHALRQKLGKTTWPVDPDFIAALDSGLPPAAGIALGIDRMIVLFTEARDLNEVIFQSVRDQLSISI